MDSGQMDKLYEQTMLFDFYGDLLTEHQRKIYEDAVFQDLSLGEIAEQQGISRQGVHDLVKRCGIILEDYEKKLHLLQNYRMTVDALNRIEELTMVEGITKVEELTMEASSRGEEEQITVYRKNMREIALETSRLKALLNKSL